MTTEPDEGNGSLVVLSLLALLVGALTGAVAAVFRLALEAADQARDVVIGWAHGQAVLGLLFVALACAAATTLAVWLARRFSPHASGSGIPHVEAVLRGELPPAPLTLLAVKFVGGILAIGSGLALGREGPCVQMGANIAHATGRIFRRSWPDCRVLMAAAAGAGLATAFNAPIAGAVFVLEELVQRFEHRIAIAALAASATAIAVARLLLGNAPDFAAGPFDDPSAASLPLFLLLGLVAALLGVAYNRTILRALDAAEWLGRWLTPEVRAALIGATIGVVAWFLPALVGGGDPITQRTLLGAETLALLPAIFLLRFVLGAASYAAGAPGGLFAPMLVLGAQLGLVFGALSHLVFPALDARPEAFAVVGVAAFFTAVVRAPVTGIVLVTEMTATVTLLLPMLGACFAAMLVPALLRSVPIYDSLRERARSARGLPGTRQPP